MRDLWRRRTTLRDACTPIRACPTACSGASLRGGGGLVLAIMLLVGGFLTYRAWQALSRREAGTSSPPRRGSPTADNFGIAAVLVGTMLIALVAIVVAVPLALGTALYISEYAPPRHPAGP